MKNIRINKYLKYSLLLFAGVLLGWLFFHSPDNKTATEAQHTETEETIWTCSMHPQIRMHEPGDCPICGMDLIPLEQGNGISSDSFAVHLTPEAAQLANVMTTLVERQKPVKVVRLYGKIEADERLLQNQTSHIPGRIEDLKVNFTGETIRKGQVLATIYSPELITAQQELIEAEKIKEIQPEIYMAARERLLHWKLTEDQINSIEHGHGSHEFDVVSNTTGVVIQKLVNNGDHINEGTILFQVADLSKVWALFDAYESDLPFINKGAIITYTVQALPGNSFSGRISFIDQVIDPVTRVAKVRVEVNNQAGRLKPQMFITGTVQSRLSQFSNDIVIPKSAVLWTGERSIVYVKDADSEDPLFRMREVTLGPSLGDSYVITDGLNEGEAVVTQGAFSVDAAAQLEGKPSMMNQPVTSDK